MPRPRRRLPPQALCVSVRLEALPTGAERPNPDWIQIAAEGEYKGHHSGRAFRLDGKAFDEIVRNFRSHPSYVEGGAADVIAFDFHHASELDPTSGSIPTEGAPAQAWARELRVQEGPKGLELWALTNFLEPMATYRRENRYRWTSVAISPNQRHPMTGENIGWYMSSVAFTNDPFIQGMVPLAASRTFDGPEDVLEALRSLFEIPAISPPDDILSALAKLRAYASGKAPAPLGVDVDCLVGELRQIFNLPTLAGVDEIFAQADALLVALAGAPPVSTIAADRKDDPDMDPYKSACIALAARLRKPLPEKEEAIPAFLCEAVDGAVAEESAKGKSAEEQVKAFLQALGVPDVEAGFAKIAETLQAAAKLKAALPALAELETMKAEKEEADVEKDVATTMAFRKMDPVTKPAMLAMRRASRERFIEAYPMPTEEQIKLARDKGEMPQTGVIGVPPRPPAKGSAKIPTLPNGTVPTLALLAAAPGELSSVKAEALVLANGGEKMTRYDRFMLGQSIARALLADAPAIGPANSL